MSEHSAADVRPLVIVVEDTLELRMLMVRALTEAGYEVLSAPDGSAAATLILGLKQHPDAVVTDLQMPVMTGERLALWLAHWYPRVPLVFISGYGDGDPSLSGPLLAKPFHPEALCTLVDQVLARSRLGVATSASDAG